MDSSPSKRRKLSPSTSVAINASPPRQLLIGDNSRQTIPSRASFLSPTKASLARFNPNLLPRPKSAGDGAQRRDSRNSFTEQQPAGLNGLTKGLNPVALRPTTPPRSPDKLTARVRAVTASPQKSFLLENKGLRAAPRRRSRTPGRESLPRTLIPSSTAPKVDVPLVQSARDTEEEVQNTASEQLELELQSNTARRPNRATFSRLAQGSPAEPDNGEPDLPLTPTQLGLEAAPEPPKGLLYSSPLRRAGIRRSSSLKSSPLKPQNEVVHRGDQNLPSQGRHNYLVEVLDGRGDVGAVDDTEGIRKKETLEHLVVQLIGLQNDVAQLESQVGHVDESSQEEVNGLLSVILSTDPTHERKSPPRKPEPVSTRLSLFLPFSKRTIPAEPKNMKPQLPTTSHRPIELEDPLPYVSAFTPLTVSSIDSLLPSSGSENMLQHHHEIFLKSPNDLLKIKLHLSVDAVTTTIASLSLNSISPWADHELGTWARKQAAEGDITNIGWACGRYWEIASIRARCWDRCCKRFHSLMNLSGDENKGNSPSHAMKEALSKQRGRKGKAGVAPEEDNESSDVEELFEGNPLYSHISRSSLLMHLGRQSLLFTQGGVSLLVSWSISFDWTGEVESHVHASTSFPKIWRNADERASLDKVGPVFTRLVRDRGVFAAVSAIVALIFGEQ